MKKRTKNIMIGAIIAIVLIGICMNTKISVNVYGPKATVVPSAAPTDLSVPVGSNMSVKFIDVGQADSTLITADGQSMLIDGGNVADSDIIASVLKKNDIDRLDYVVCTHAHEDHVGGLSGALSVASVDTVYAPITGADTKAYTNFVEKVSEQGLELTHPVADMHIPFGNGTVTFLGPVHEQYDDINNTSIVLRIDYGSTSFLFMGDAERESEQDILNEGYNLKADVLKVGHHGSASSTTYPFLREVMPQYAVISCGKDNSYGHPDPHTVSRLTDAGAQVLRTDIEGDIEMVSDGSSIAINKE